MYCQHGHEKVCLSTAFHLAALPATVNTVDIFDAPMARALALLSLHVQLHDGSWWLQIEILR